MQIEKKNGCENISTNLKLNFLLFVAYLLSFFRYVVLNSGVLQIYDVTSSDVANYSCTAKNIDGERTSRIAKLTVSQGG